MKLSRQNIEKREGGLLVVRAIGYSLKVSSEKQLCNLDRIQCGAFADLVT